MRVVLDTNILISALITKGTPPDVDLSPDPKDNPILATAIAGKTDLIVSGDKKHMLALDAELIEKKPAFIETCVREFTPGPSNSATTT